MIKSWRLYLDLSQEEVAKKLNISQSAYCQIENKKIHRKSTLQKIAAAFGIGDWRYLKEV